MARAFVNVEAIYHGKRVSDASQCSADFDCVTVQSADLQACIGLHVERAMLVMRQRGVDAEDKALRFEVQFIGCPD